MKKIMIDMDDVICEGGFLYQLNRFLGTNYKETDMVSYYMQDMIPEERQEEWNRYLAEQNLYAEGNRILPGAKEVIRKLAECYEVYIVTAYIIKDNPSQCGKHLFNKFEWLCKEFPFLHPSCFSFVNHKDLIDCDIKIDDRLSNLSGKAETKLLFDAYHNRNITKEELENCGVRRVCSWYEIEEILLKEMSYSL
ncbi:MAG: hypothetical protein J6M02_06415 [Clostridia bacterium]|nr:hypothetical protein [Clostridia bacterium]